MRLIIAGLLVVGGGLAALALVWAFYSTQNPTSTSTTSIVSDQSPVASSDQLSSAATSEDAPQTAPEDAPDDTADRTPSPGSPAAAPASDAAQTDNQADSDTPDAVLQIEVVRIGPDGSAVFAGRGSAAADIQIFEQDKTLAQTTVAPSGEWVAIADEPLSPGNHLIIVELRTADGQLVRADRAIVVELAASGDDKPLVALVPMTQQAEAELIQAPEELVTAQEQITVAEGTSARDETLTPEVAALLVEPARLQLLTLSWADDKILQIKGLSSGGQSVRGALNDRPFAARLAPETGDWTATIDTTGLNARSAQLLSQLLDEAGEVVASRQIDFDFAQLDIGRDGSDMVVIEKGDMLWRIAYRTYGDGIRYLDIVRRNQTRISDPDLIYPAQIFALPESAATEDKNKGTQ